MLQSPRALGAITLAAVVTAFGAVSVAHAGDHPAKAGTITKNCSSAGTCLTYNNTSTGSAMSATTIGEGTAFTATASAGGGDGLKAYGAYIGVVGRADAGTNGFPFVGTDQNGNILFAVDGSGDLYYAGSLYQFAKTREGRAVRAYAPQSTTRTLEDVGSAQLINGQATIALDPTYARSIDLSSAYHVFLTPNGDTKGLFIAQKSPTSFVVRETQGGRGSLAFDYRIVATQLGGVNQRMGVTPLPAMPVTR